MEEKLEEKIETKEKKKIDFTILSKIEMIFPFDRTLVKL